MAKTLAIAKGVDVDTTTTGTTTGASHGSTLNPAVHKMFTRARPELLRAHDARSRVLRRSGEPGRDPPEAAPAISADEATYSLSKSGSSDRGP